MVKEEKLFKFMHFSRFVKLVNNVKLSVFCKEGEDEELITKKLCEFVPFNLEEEKVGLGKSTAFGFGEKKIGILEIMLEKDRHMKKFIESLNSRLNEEQKALIRLQADSRLDERLNFFLRFDKEKLVNEGTLWLTDSGNCFHIRINIAAFPRSREAALKIVGWIFNGMQS